jgi:uncharacterized membrane protein
LCKIIDMETTMKHVYARHHDDTKVSIWKKFIDWCISQEKYRLGWLATAITLHGCVLTISTMFAVVLAGNHFIFWPFIIGGMGITIPVFFFSVLVDLVIIISCIAIGFDASGTRI